MNQLAFESWVGREQDELLRAAWFYDRARLMAEDWQVKEGFCVPCASRQALRLVPGADPAEPNTRENLVCMHCGLNSRVRAALGLLFEKVELTESTRIYLSEQATHTFVWMQSNLPCEVTGSEFEPDASRRLELSEYLHTIGGLGEVQFNDVTNLDFADGELDAIVSFDVLEHVPDYKKALSEFSRVLAEDGLLIATFPFCDAPRTVVRARIGADGIVEHLCEPEFHGDPISGGVLCYYHFGWDILEDCRRSGFREAQMVMPWSPANGMYYGMWTLVARK
jgi:SAM-dependent methyltransferase